MLLFRAHPRGQFGRPGEFWSTDPRYPRVVHGENAPYASARLNPLARVLRFREGSPSAPVLARLRHSWDAAVWPIWDHPGEEVVIFNPAILLERTPHF